MYTTIYNSNKLPIAITVSKFCLFTTKLNLMDIFFKRRLVYRD